MSAELSHDELQKLGISTSAEMQAEAFARILLVGAMKVGKTTAILETAPGPVLHGNCDGEAAAIFPAKRGAKFLSMPVKNRATWKKFVDTSVQLAKDGKVKTIVIDTVTLLADSIVRECENTLSGYDIWAEVERQLKNGLSKLLEAPAHIFLVAHIDPREDTTGAGILPLIKGKATAVWIPSKISDWVLFECDPMKKPMRRFLLGPQKNWNHSGRRIAETCEIEADVVKMFEKMGITP